MLLESYDDVSQYAQEVLLHEARRKGRDGEQKDSIWRPGGRTVRSQIGSGLKYGAMVGVPLAAASGAAIYAAGGGSPSQLADTIRDTGGRARLPRGVRVGRSEKYFAGKNAQVNKFIGDTWRRREAMKIARGYPGKDLSGARAALRARDWS